MRDRPHADMRVEEDRELVALEFGIRLGQRLIVLLSILQGRRAIELLARLPKQKLEEAITVYQKPNVLLALCH